LRGRDGRNGFGAADFLHRSTGNCRVWAGHDDRPVDHELGARLAIVDGSTNSDVTTFVTDFMLASANVIASDVTVTITVTPATGNPAAGDVSAASTRDLVNVNVAVPFSKVSYITGNFLEGKTLSGQSAMRHE
jgi:hypothetical protein